MYKQYFIIGLTDLQDSYRSRFMLSEEGDKLEIRDVNLIDAGEYRCFVGEKQHGINLHVTGLIK